MELPEESTPSSESLRTKNKISGWLITGIIIGIAGVLCLTLWLSLGSRAPKEVVTDETKEKDAALDVSQQTTEIKLATVTSKAPATSFSVAGTVEANPQQQQQVTPLVSGRVRNIYVVLGDIVKPGTLLVQIDSPQVAELHGKLHEAETRHTLAKQNVLRAQQSANRVSVLKAKSSLDEAESNLKRTKLLVSEGLTARKDLIATESEFERAKAEYNFQKDISLNKEIAQAKAELQTSETEVEHIRDALKAFDASVGKENTTEHNISNIELRSPISGTVIERFVNPGSGFEQGKALLTIASTNLLWVIANVPESQMEGVRVGSLATVKIGDKQVTGDVSYIDPRLNEDTRTSRVRIEISNPQNKIQVGAFAQIEFKRASIPSSPLVPQSAVQIVDGKPVVFVKDANTGKFNTRSVQTGSAFSGMVPITSGVIIGEQVAADGSFILKSKMLREQFGEE